MQSHTDGSIGHRKTRRRLAGRRAIDGNGPHDPALSGRQALEMTIDVAYEHVRFALAACQDFGKIVERKVDPAAAPTQRIDHFMARDGPQPRANRRSLVPALPLEMNGKQRLLHNVLGVGIGHSGTAKAPARHRAKHRRQLQQETPVGIRVAGIAGTHQQGPLLFSTTAAQNDPYINSAAAGQSLHLPCGLVITFLSWKISAAMRNARAPSGVEERVETARSVYRWRWGKISGSPQL